MNVAIIVIVGLLIIVDGVIAFGGGFACGLYTTLSSLQGLSDDLLSQYGLRLKEKEREEAE